MKETLNPQKIAVLSRKETDYTHQLILHNDDINSIDHVVNALMLVCKHSPEQAEQCATIAHHNGKCEVKRGHYQVLEDMLMELRNANLIVEIKS